VASVPAGVAASCHPSRMPACSARVDHHENGRAERMSVFTRSIRAYFEAQHCRAEQTWAQWRQSAGAGRRDSRLRLLAPTFQGGMNRRVRFAASPFPALRSLSDNLPLDLDRFADAFISFLTFRSRGIPRRARLILETFIRPYDRVANLDKVRSEDREAQHVLYFDDRDRVRVELVSELYHAIEGAPGALEWRDDKVLMAVFQFADFLTRFHRRAFSLQSLERFEELMHVHRAPDTSLLAAQLISDWLGSLLETTAAGIHTYRFRLEWAAEIAALSRASQHESASANFTLDETQALKAQLRALLADEKGEGGAFEVHTALAELHDLDGDHLEARHQFRRAIEILDGRLKQEFLSGGTASQGPVARLLSSDNPIESTERQLDWALARVRIMLQLGLTYERTFDYERAGLEYGNALQVAKAIWRSKSTLLPTLANSRTALLEPIFAQAWAALKDPVVTESPYVAARNWLSELLLRDEGRGLNPENRWQMLTNHSPALANWSRELNMLGDLAFFSVPRWSNDLDHAANAYCQADRVAATKENPEHEQRARSLVSLSLCSLLRHREEPTLNFDTLEEFASRLERAQKLAVAAPSSQGPFADSMAIHQLGLEIAEELWHLCRATVGDCRQLSESICKLFVEPPSNASLSPLRSRMLSDARWRLRGLKPEWERFAPSRAAFPTRNRFLNFRSELVDADFGHAGFTRLLRMWRRFDSRSTLPPCRLAIAAPGSSAAKIVWDESEDISKGGKRYFAWLRDRYYLDDGFGPMLLRANFALTVGFQGVHLALAKDGREARAQKQHVELPPPACEWVTDVVLGRRPVDDFKRAPTQGENSVRRRHPVPDGS
jgi:tetratricopeptide (TPR) repeat protein